MTNFPKPPAGSAENRHIVCQMSVETPLQDLVEDAVQRGWTDAEVLAAIIEVADNLMLASKSNADLNELIVSVRKNAPKS